MSARASATRWRCPPESWLGRRPSYPSSRTIRSASVTRVARSALATLRTISPYATLSPTVMWGNSA